MKNDIELLSRSGDNSQQSLIPAQRGWKEPTDLQEVSLIPLDLDLIYSGISTL